MQTNEIVGIALFAFAVLAATAQVAFACGQQVQANKQVQANIERERANRRARGVLASVNRNREALQ